jgi:HTH-type transcriptional regulator/antitoxin HigA
MAQTTQLKAAKKFSLGYFIHEQLVMHQWSTEDLANKMGLSEKQLYNIYSNRRPITSEIARLLGEIFETSSQYWINIDTEFRSWIEQEKTLKS